MLYKKYTNKYNGITSIGYLIILNGWYNPFNIDIDIIVWSLIVVGFFALMQLNKLSRTIDRCAKHFDKMIKNNN